MEAIQTILNHWQIIVCIVSFILLVYENHTHIKYLQNDITTAKTAITEHTKQLQDIKIVQQRHEDNLQMARELRLDVSEIKSQLSTLIGKLEEKDIIKK